MYCDNVVSFAQRERLQIMRSPMPVSHEDCCGCLFACLHSSTRLHPPLHPFLRTQHMLRFRLATAKHSVFVIAMTMGRPSGDGYVVFESEAEAVRARGALVRT